MFGLTTTWRLDGKLDERVLGDHACTLEIEPNTACSRQCFGIAQSREGNNFVRGRLLIIEFLYIVPHT